MFLRLVLAILTAFMAMTVSEQSVAQQRIALVIGNGAYSSVGELQNPPNDARLVAETLRSLGFDVQEEIDVAQKPLKKAIKAFGKRLGGAGKDAVGLFYFAGHGVQVDGENYLIPVNVDISDEADVDIEAVSMTSILRTMEFAGNDMNIIIMDACRNNPFKRSFRSATRGLARVDAAKGTLLAYATAPGDVAADGSGLNSPYTLALASSLVKPGVTIERMFKEVRNSVVQATGSAQIPWESSSLIGGDFYFNTDTSVGSGAVSGQPAALSNEAIFWQSIENSVSAQDYEAYLHQYPDGVFSSLAQIKLNQINGVNTEVASRSTTSGLTGFAPGTYSAEILPGSTGECKQISIEELSATDDQVVGYWKHPQANGTIKFDIQNEMVALKWKGHEIRSNRELVQINGSSLFVDVLLRHSEGSCKIAFKLSDILAN